MGLNKHDEDIAHRGEIKESHEYRKHRNTKQERLSLYTIDMKYIRNLHRRDDRVRSVSPQIGKENRVFVGIVVICGERKYCIPLSHPKDKHGNMKGRIDFSKVFDEQGKMIAALDFNMMVPVEEAQLYKMDLKIHPNDTLEMKHYKKLCQREIDWCQRHQREICDKANVLYNMYLSGENFKARSRCLDFPKLELECDKYNRKS